MVTTFADLIGSWPRGSVNGRQLTSIATFAKDVGVAYSHAQIMRYRNSISADHWPRVVNAAKKRHKNISHEDLLRMRERAKEDRSRPRVVMSGVVAA